MNRIEDAIIKTRTRIAQRIKDELITQQQIDKARHKLNMLFDEYCKFQELKSIATIDGTLTQSEAQSVYAYLGETPSTFNTQSLEVKTILTLLFQELLNRQITQLKGEQ